MTFSSVPLFPKTKTKKKNKTNTIRLSNEYEKQNYYQFIVLWKNRLNVRIICHGWYSTHLKISLGIFVLMQSDLPLITVYSDTS